MLVLTRKIGESIIIADDIRVTVLEVRGNQIRLGFSAPQNVRIQREEICFDPPRQRPEGLPASEAAGK